MRHILEDWVAGKAAPKPLAVAEESGTYRTTISKASNEQLIIELSKRLGVSTLNGHHHDLINKLNTTPTPTPGRAE